jgi:acyl carrier protein
LPTDADIHATDANAVNGAESLGIACALIDSRDDRFSRSPVTHVELVTLFQWLNKRCGIGPKDRCLLLPGMAACNQLYDTLGMLIAGACIEITDASDLRDTSQLVERLMDTAITLWDLPSALMQNLLPKIAAFPDQQNGLHSLRNILLSGEKQSVSLAYKLPTYFLNAQVTGLYSDPAVGIWTTVFSFHHGSMELDSAAIAHSIPSFEHRVLNKSNEPAPFHTKGALQIGRSASEPASAQQPVKTGLRAEALDNKLIKWLRREDHCFVKYECCVELTKIEDILCQHEHILSAEVITVKTDQNDDGLVVAFIIAEPDRVSEETVRDFLVLRNDVDLIPDRFILVDEFPLTSEGAIDQNVLIGQFAAAPDLANTVRSVELEEIHRQLKRIWLEALQIDDVDEDESFFARGGNSLKATLLIARIRDEFSVDLSVQHFFRKPSTRAVAELIEAESKSARTRQKGPDFKAVSREKYRVQISGAEA